MSNVHTPHRLTGESKDAYRARRADSRKIVEKMTLTGSHQPGKTTSREEHRAAMHRSGSMRKQAGAYGRGLRNMINRQQRDRMEARHAKLMGAM